MIVKGYYLCYSIGIILAVQSEARAFLSMYIYRELVMAQFNDTLKSENVALLQKLEQKDA